MYIIYSFAFTVLAALYKLDSQAETGINNLNLHKQFLARNLNSHKMSHKGK